MEGTKLTGYPSVDKPWLKYYSEEAINGPLPECTVYDYMLSCNAGHEMDTAINYFHSKITYKQLFASIEKAAKAFRHIGVKKGDIVMMCLTNTPEAVVAFYALNYIGAISNWIDLRTIDNEFEQTLCESNSEVLVILDSFCTAAAAVLDKTSIKHVIVVMPDDEGPFIKKSLYRIGTAFRKSQRLPQNKRFTRWSDFMQVSSDETVEQTQYEKNAPAVILHTGGTTGISKGVVLSNDNLNAQVFQFRQGYLLDFMRSDKQLVLATAVCRLWPL